MPHFQQFAECPHIGMTAGEFVVYFLGRQYRHIEAVGFLMQPGYFLCGFCIFRICHYQHVRGRHGVYVLIVYSHAAGDGTRD